MSFAGPILPDMSMHNSRIKPRREAGVLTRLRRSRKGNTLVIAAASMVPLAGMVGGGLDLSRLYLVKTRLQHACDAGVLAGRKSMGAGIWSQNDNQPLKTANLFFDGNFEDGAYGSKNMQRTFSESAGKVNGVARADVPMTLMRIFSKPTQRLVVGCDAEMRLPNTDVMFVLDTTGSMQDMQPGDSVSKLSALKTAVKCFYEIVARLDTDANCTTGKPGGGTGSQVQIRFGFVPYATNVNVGYLLKPEWFANSGKYQTREAKFVDVQSTDTKVVPLGVINQDRRNDWSTTYQADVSNGTCSGVAVPADTAFENINREEDPREVQTSGSNPRTKTWVTLQYGRYFEYRRTYDGRTCRVQRQSVYGDLRRRYTETTTTNRKFDQWRYSQLPVNISLLKNGSSWNRSFAWPVGSQGTDRTINWGGCIEERRTVSQASYVPIPAGAKDLDIDSVPSDEETRWKPALPELTYTRRNQSNRIMEDLNLADEKLAEDYLRDFYYACPAEAKKLQQWPDAAAFSAYVDSLYYEGNTYHDIGLLWGARFASPTGIFKSENAYTPQGGEIERNIIFMTDGDTCTGVNNYTAYGVNWWDRRTTGTEPTEPSWCNGSLTDQVNARTEGLCTAIKNKNITLWVVAFGTLSPSTVTRLKACATSGRYFTANNAPQLQATFKSIADQISQLRLTS